MRTLHGSRPHTTVTNRADRRSVRTNDISPRRPSPQRIADGVTASYIHNISSRRHSIRSSHPASYPPPTGQK
jgi:hypothetical protein